MASIKQEARMANGRSVSVRNAHSETEDALLNFIVCVQTILSRGLSKEQSLSRNKYGGYENHISSIKWRLPTLPHVCSTIGVTKLNFSVRNGKRWNLRAIITSNIQLAEHLFSVLRGGFFNQFPPSILIKYTLS